MLIDLPDARLNVDVVSLAKHFVAGAKHVIEQFEFSGKQVKNANIGIVAGVQEIDHNHIIFLTITMAAANALLDTLRVPRKVIIDDQRAELQVQAFGCGFGGNHYISLMLEIIDGGCTPVGGLDTTDAVRVSEAPLLVDFVGLWFAGFAIEQNNAIGVAIGFEEVF